MFDFSNRDANQFYNPAAGVVTSQRTYELQELVKIYHALKPKRVLEIGSQEGGTLWHWLVNAPDGATVVNIDILQNQTAEVAGVLPGLWQSWAPAGVTLHTLIGRSQDPDVQAAVRKILPEIDFLFVDGDHTYAGARSDFEMYGAMVRKGGVIAFHDLICPGPPQEHIQVGRLWREIQRAGYVTRELYSAESQAWGAIGVVYV